MQTDPKLVGLVAMDLGQLCGRAAFAALYKANQAYSQAIEVEMAQLVQRSKVDGVALILRLERRAAGTLFLRWSIRHRASRWEEMDEELGALTAPLQRHYAALHRRAGELNALAVIVQQAMRWARSQAQPREHGRRQGQKEQTVQKGSRQ